MNTKIQVLTNYERKEIPKGVQRVITQRERRLAEEAGFNPDLWSDEALWEMMDYFEARKRGAL